MEAKAVRDFSLTAFFKNRLDPLKGRWPGRRRIKIRSAAILLFDFAPPERNGVSDLLYEICGLRLA
jgi:hypothetical protein